MTEKDLEIFQAYQAGTLTAAEKQAFEDQLANDPELSLAWNDFLNLVTGIQATGRAQTRQQIQMANERYQQAIKRKKIRRRWLNISVAASLGIGLIIGVSLLQLQQKQAHALQTTYYENPEAILKKQLDDLETMGFAHSPAEADSLFLQGLQALENQQLTKAVGYLSRVSEQKNQAPCQFFLGMAYQQLQNEKKAIQLWNQLPADAPKSIRQAARYELSWAYAKRPWGLFKAKKIWRKIAQDSTDVHQVAIKRMLKELE